jgi:hypothetical protein
VTEASTLFPRRTGFPFAPSVGVKPINREDFVTLLKNKTEPEVIQIAGKRAAVDAPDQSDVVWIYKQRTFDVPTRRKDPETDAVFSRGEDGKMHVAEVTFK